MVPQQVWKTGSGRAVLSLRASLTGSGRHCVKDSSAQPFTSISPWAIVAKPCVCSQRCAHPFWFMQVRIQKWNFFFFNLFIYFWLCWVFVSMRGLFLVVASGGHSSSRCAGLSLSRPLLLRGTGSRRAGSVIVAHGPSCSAACGIFPDQGSNPCPLHWQADSQPLRHQGSPRNGIFNYVNYLIVNSHKRKDSKWNQTLLDLTQYYPQRSTLRSTYR